MRNAVSRKRCARVCDDSSSSSKTSESGRKEIVVPVSPLAAFPTSSTLRRRLPARELLAIDLALAPDLGDQPLGESVHDRDAHPVEAAGDLVPLAAELSAGVKLGQDDRERRQSLVFHDAHRDAGAPVADGDGVVRMEANLDALVSPRERLVDGVVDHLVDEMVEPARTRRADVHPRSQANRLEALENGDVLGVVTGFCHKKSLLTGYFCLKLSLSERPVVRASLRTCQTGRGGPRDNLSEGADRRCSRRSPAPPRRPARTELAQVVRRPRQSSAPGSGRRPGAKRRRGGAAASSRSPSRARTVPSRWVSSNAQALELVATWSVPSRPIRAGQALAAMAAPTAAGQAATTSVIAPPGPSWPSSRRSSGRCDSRLMPPPPRSRSPSA